MYSCSIWYFLLLGNNIYHPTTIPAWYLYRWRGVGGLNLVIDQAAMAERGLFLMKKRMLYII